MPSQKIMIDVYSITKNRNAGQTSEKDDRVFVVAKYSGKCPKFLKPENGCHIHKESEIDGKKIVDVKILNPEILRFALDENIKGYMGYEIGSEPYERQFNEPIPSHAFNYEEVEISCRFCHASFLSSELEFKEYQDSDGKDCISHSTCPKCGEAECCELEFETLEEALKRFIAP